MLQFDISPQGEVLVAQVTGLVSLPAWEQLLREMAAALSQRRHDRLVVNLTQLVGWLGVPERTSVGALMATHLRGMKKVALFIQPQKITGVVQTEAQRQGLQLRLFSEYEEALNWAVS
jgi:hypothetical protein